MEMEAIRAKITIGNLVQAISMDLSSIRMLVFVLQNVSLAKNQETAIITKNIIVTTQSHRVVVLRPIRLILSCR